MAIVHDASIASVALVATIATADASAVASVIVVGLHSWVNAGSIPYSIVALAAAIAASVEHARIQ